MGLRNLHTFDAEYASAHGMLKALYAFAKRKNTKSIPSFNYVVQFACREGAWLAAAKDLGSTSVMGIDSKEIGANQVLRRCGQTKMAVAL